MPTFPYIDWGPYKIIQTGVLLVVVGTWLLAVWRARRNKSSSHDSNHRRELEQRMAEQRVFLDGPIKVALDTLADIYQVLKDLLGDNRIMERDFRDRHEKKMQLLAEISNELSNVRSGIDQLKNSIDNLRNSIDFSLQRRR